MATKNLRSSDSTISAMTSPSVKAKIKVSKSYGTRYRSAEDVRACLLGQLKRCYTVTGAGCWEWNGQRDDAGYPYFERWLSRGGLSNRAHRAQLELKLKRRLGRYEFACHECDNPPCINPEHIWLGSGKKNAEDRDVKGRNGRPHSAETKLKMSVSAKALNKVLSPEHLEKLRTSNLGNTYWVGRRHSEETKAKISAARRDKL